MKKKKITIMAVIIILLGSTFLPLLSFRAPGMVEKTMSGIIVYCVPEDMENAQKMISDITEQRDRIISALPGTNADAIDLVIYPDQKSLHINTFGLAGYFFPSWYIGKNTKDRVLITSPSHPGPSHSRESIEKAVIHEYVHVLTDRINRDIGYWLKEGLALYLAEQIPADKEVLTSTEKVTYENFSSHNPFKFANYGGYSMAHSYIKFLDEEYAWEKVIQLLDNNLNYEEVLGLSEEETFLKWQEWVMENYT